MIKAEVNFYKSTGKWYTKADIVCSSFDMLEKQVESQYSDMDYTIHIIEEDGFRQSYRLFKR